MKRRFLPALACLTAWLLVAPGLPSQTHRRTNQEADAEPARLPNGKLQQDEILKADHDKCIKDTAQLIDLAESLKQDLEKDDAHVL